MKKGFTLIELLAVIVILAIIALIATPIILNIIDDASKSSSEISMDNLDYAVDLYYQRKELNGTFRPITFICKDGICTSGTETLEIDGKGIQRGIISIDSNGNATYSAMLINGYKCNIVNKEATCEIGSESTVTSESNEIVLIDGNSTALSNYKIYGNSIQNPAPTISTPVKVQSVGDYDEITGKYKIPITVRGKNLFSSTFTIGYNLNTNTGAEYEKSTSAVSDYIPIDFSNSSYYLSGLPNTLWNFVAAYNENKEFLGRTGGGAKENRNLSETEFNLGTAQGTGDIAYIRVTIYENNAGGTVDEVENLKIQLEEGTTGTTYEPYVTPVTTNIYLDEPLRKIGKYVDYIDFEKQQVVRKVKEIILNGTETWSMSASLDNTHMFQVIIDDEKDDNVYYECLTNFFEYKYGIYSVDEEGCAIFKTSAGTYIRIRINNGIASNSTNFKEWLAKNNITLDYIQKKEEPIELPTINTYDVTNIIEVGTSVSPSSIEVTYLK